MIEVITKTYVNEFYAVQQMAWSGACDVLREIEEQGRETEFMEILDMYFSADMYPNGVEDTTINDFIWFEVAYMMNL